MRPHRVRRVGVARPRRGGEGTVGLGGSRRTAAPGRRGAPTRWRRRGRAWAWPRSVAPHGPARPSEPPPWGWPPALRAPRFRPQGGIQDLPDQGGATGPRELQRAGRAGRRGPDRRRPHAGGGRVEPSLDLERQVAALPRPAQAESPHALAGLEVAILPRGRDLAGLGVREGAPPGLVLEPDLLEAQDRLRGRSARRRCGSRGSRRARAGAGAAATSGRRPGAGGDAAASTTGRGSGRGWRRASPPGRAAARGSARLRGSRRGSGGHAAPPWTAARRRSYAAARSRRGPGRAARARTRARSRRARRRSRARARRRAVPAARASPARDRARSARRPRGRRS